MLFLHQHSLKPPLNTVVPTISGSLINGQVLTGSSGTWDRAYSDIQYRWQAAASPYTDYSTIASTTSYTLTGSEIGKRIIRGVRVRNVDGWSAWADSVASAIVQDSPALPLDLTGTPVLSAVINSPYSFTVAGLNGVPGSSPNKYTFSLGGTWPPGKTITPNASGDQATVAGPFTASGTYGGLTVNVLDSVGSSDSIGPFSVTVLTADAVKLTPGSGWGTTATDPPASAGSSSNVGWGHKPFLAWATAQFPTESAPFIVKLIALTVPTLSDYQANGTPVAGNGPIQAAVGNGTWATIPAVYDTTDNIWCYKLLIDPADFPDGTWLTDSGLREIRVKGVGKNGDGEVMQGSPHVYPYAYVGFKFSTNYGGTLSTPVKYCSPSGSDTTGDGSNGNPWATIAKAVNSTPAGGIIKLKAGTSYRLDGVPTQPADNGRWHTIQADDGLTSSQVVIQSVGSTSSWKPKRIKIVGCGLGYTVPLNNGLQQALYLKSCKTDPGISQRNVPNVSTWNYGASDALTYIEDSTVTNCNFGPTRAQLVRNVQVGSILSDVFGYCRVVINSSCDEILSGSDTAGVSAHPDTCQYSLGASNYTYDWYWGACHWNVTINTGRANAQGPFFKDVGFFHRFFLINWNFKMSSANSGRNAIYLHNDGVNYSTMLGSMFWNVTLDGNGTGIRAWNGACDDVVAVNVVLSNMRSGANSVPSSMLNYSA